MVYKSNETSILLMFCKHFMESMSFSGLWILPPWSTEKGIVVLCEAVSVEDDNINLTNMKGGMVDAKFLVSD